MTVETAASRPPFLPKNENLIGDAAAVSALRERVRLLRSFIRDLVALTGWAPVQALALMVASGFVQGAGLLMLVPLLGVIGLAGDGAAGGPVSGIMSFAFDTVGLPRSLGAVVAVYVSLVGAQAYLARLQTLSGARLERGMVVRLRDRMFRTLAHADWLYFMRRRASHLTHALTLNVGDAGRVAQLLVRLTGTAIMMGVYLVAAFFLSPLMTIVAAGGGLLIAYLFGYQLRAAPAEGGQEIRTRRDLFAAGTEYLQAIKLAKSHDATDRSIERFGAASEQAEARMLQFTRAQADLQFGFAVSSAVLVAVFLVVALQVMHLPIASFLILLYIFSRLAPRSSQLFQGLHQLSRALSGYAMLRAVEQEARSAAEPAADPSLPEPSLARELELERVGFSYTHGAEPRTLDDITLRVPVRTTTAIVGPSGAGKSTLVDIMLGLIPPDNGALRIDGKSLLPGQVVPWRRRVGYVPQDPMLLHDTVRANLLWAKPEATEAELWGALRLAAADEFVTALPQGLDTVVGDRGARVSGGERQRIALARALLRRPDLLLLDEATSYLDPGNERRVLDAIEGLHGQLTIVMVTHRLSSLHGVDRIAVLEGGKVVEEGSWDVLTGQESGRFLDLLDDAGKASARARE